MPPIVYPPQTPAWQQIYVQTEERACVETALNEELARLGYHAYDPFPGGVGTPPSLKDFVRMFVAPAAATWVGIAGLCPTGVRETLLAALEPCG
ncbi:MAG: hypothetical protein EHM89_18140, partial [Acidobacteria bacterium]